jgi:hypothetical protein
MRRWLLAKPAKLTKPAISDTSRDWVRVMSDVGGQGRHEREEEG